MIFSAILRRCVCGHLLLWLVAGTVVKVEWTTVLLDAREGRHLLVALAEDGRYCRTCGLLSASTFLLSYNLWLQLLSLVVVLPLVSERILGTL